ncbi:unnamed protein product [Ascophyllum nodosum]
MVVFGDSFSDSGRRFNAPASFDFEGIGPFPWVRLYEAKDAEETFDAYVPSRGSVTNGKVWTEYLNVPQDLNFATSSGRMTETFRALETCMGYTGEGEEFPTGVSASRARLTELGFDSYSYTHVIILGTNDFSAVVGAATRLAIAQTLRVLGVLEEPYEDPIPSEKVFRFVGGIPQFDFEPAIAEIAGALSEGVERLIDAGVTGKILIGNIGSFRASHGLAASGQADTFEPVALAAGTALQRVVDAYPQLQLLDLYSLTAAIVDAPQAFTELGFREPQDAVEGDPVPLSTPCLKLDFFIDDNAEIMGTQALRAAGCQEECALCADSSSPCQNCFLGNPSAAICDDPDTRIFWDDIHFTTGIHRHFAAAVVECSRDFPDPARPFVEQLCPHTSSV